MPGEEERILDAMGPLFAAHYLDPAVAKAMIAALGELERAGAQRIEVRRQAAEAFERELRGALSKTVWHTGCTNWYVDENGNDPNQWPWLWSTYRRRTAKLSPEAYEYRTSAGSPAGSLG